MSSPLLVLERTVAISRALDRAGIAHAFGGALALAYHVENPRGTNDIDVNVTSDPERPDVVFAALPSEVEWSADDVQRAARDGQVRLRWPNPQGSAMRSTPVDVFLPQHEFHAVVATRTESVPMLDTEVPILSATDLTVFKALFDRLKDWADIEELLRYGDVDVAEVLHWLGAVVGRDDERIARFAALAASARGRGEPPTAAELFGRRPR